MIQFSKVFEVKAGDQVTSTQIASLAEAVNQRIRSGLGDPVFRIWFYLFAMFRQIRNCDESGYVWPAHAEFFEYYQNIDPTTGITWPTADPGEYEGANLASIMNAFVFGAEAIDLDNEQVRSEVVDLSSDSTPSGVWEMAKRQRGAIDPTTNNYASPAFDAAREMYKIMTAPSSGHGNSFGGYVPSPHTNGFCEGVDANGDPTRISPRQEIFFTNIHTGEKIQYTGNCPETEGDLAGVVYTPFFYVLYNWHYGTAWAPVLAHVLDVKDWVEGPYSGPGVLRKLWGNHIPRVINAFLKDFRGTETQREDINNLLSEAADWQAFFTRQYNLSPQRGRMVGPNVVPDYPKFTLTASAASGTRLAHSEGYQNTHIYKTGFVLTGIYVKALKLASATTLELVSNGAVVRTITLTPDANGSVDMIDMLDAPIAKPGRIFFQTGNTVTLSEGGSIKVEVTELAEYKPEIHDAYLVMRLATCNDLTSGIEGRGVDESNSRMAMQAHLNTGAIINVNGGLSPAVPSTANVNPVWDAARRLSKHARVINRLQFAGYEVKDGKSILYFRRYALGNSAMDSFNGIAPSTAHVPCGSIKPGIAYKVKSGTITYNGASYQAVNLFTGVWGVTDYTPQGSTPVEVVEVEGIRHTAPETGWTNEWMLDLSLKAYHPSETSMWKPSNYGDFWPWLNRCHLLPYVGQDAVMAHESPSGGHGLNLGGPMRWVIPEGPSGYTYAEGMNYDGGANQLDFLKSCRVYEPSNEINSVTMTDDGLVRVELKDRLQHCENAPASIPRNTDTWNEANLRAEPYRTKENGLREYLLHISRSNYNASVKVGDNAALSNLQSQTDNPYGCVYPHFFLCQLVPKPWSDANDTPEPKDTPCTVDVFNQIELYLRALCEGAIDDETTAKVGCDEYGAHAYDFTWTNFCIQAFGEKSIGILPKALRPDAPEGFGPLPNTNMYADTFNRFARAINLIHRYRVPVKYQLQIRTREGDAVANHDVDWSNYNGMGVICFGVTPPVPTLSEWTEWSESGVAQAIGTSAITAQGDFVATIQTHGQECEWKLSLSDPRVFFAFPPAWRDMVDTERSQVFAKFEAFNGATKAVQVSTQEASDKCCLPAQCDQQNGFYWLPNEGGGGVGYQMRDHLADTVSTCIAAPRAGTLSAYKLKDGDYSRGDNAGAACAAGPAMQSVLSFMESDGVVLDVEVK